MGHLPGAAEQRTEGGGMRGSIMMGMGVQVSNGLEVQPTIDSNKATEEEEATIMKKLGFHENVRGFISVTGSCSSS